MKKLVLLIAIVALTGCSSIKKYWPRSHDPVLFDHLVAVDIAVEQVDCDKADWNKVRAAALHLNRYAEWRQDPQAENLKGLSAHADRMAKGGSKAFCEIGKKTGRARIEAAKSAWEGR
jgi:uncharacterized protein YceK